MYMVKLSMSFIYLLSLFMFINSSTLLLNWILLEINALSFITLMVKYWESMTAMLYYLLIQSLGSFFFLLGSFCSEAYMYSVYIMIFSLILKLGFFPLHFWFFKLSNVISCMSLLVLLTIQKLPGFYLLYHLFDLYVFYAMLANVLVGCILLYLSKYLSHLLVSSSIYMGYWNLVLFILSPMLFFIYYFIYSVSLYLGISLGGLIKSLDFMSGLFSLIFMSVLLMGLPPLSIFLMKFYFVTSFYDSLSILHLSSIWLSSFLCMMGYIKYFLKKIEHSLNLVNGPSMMMKSLFYYPLCMLMLMGLIF